MMTHEHERDQLLISRLLCLNLVNHLVIGESSDEERTLRVENLRWWFYDETCRDVVVQFLWCAVYHLVTNRGLLIEFVYRLFVCLFGGKCVVCCSALVVVTLSGC